MADSGARLRRADPEPEAEAGCEAAPERHSGLRRLTQDDGQRSFLRMVSHELRTPLNAIIGFSEIIAQELHGPINEPRYREHAELVRDSGLKLLTLVNQIVDIARLEAGAMDLDSRPETVREVVEEALASVDAKADARGVALDVEVGPAVDRVMCDRRGLGTVLGALLDNAVAFSPDGGRVLVRLRRLQGQVMIEVCDQGEGVEPGEIPRLMRPFEQGENALVRRCAGAGLGLPTARLLTRAMGGRLRLHSHPGEGTIAVVRLPAAPHTPRAAG